MIRRRIVAFVFAFLLLLISPLSLPESPAAAAAYTCLDFQNWESAQVIYDHDVSTHDALDPDGTSVACNELARGGFAPAYWTNEIPRNVIRAEITGVTDGDTLAVTIDGHPDIVRLYRADTPETSACGGLSASEFTRQALSENDEGTTIYLESDQTDRDRYDRKLAYVWWETVHAE